jgi:2-methylisocitrate lyase-like PEP mutase family enzyme
LNLASQVGKAEKLRSLHRGSRALVLPNAWDAAVARVFEDAGVPAVATTSAGIAFSLGYPDGQQISRDNMLETIARIASALKIPVTADVEAGYGARPEDAAETATAVIEAGAVGLNLEDSIQEGGDETLVPLPLQIEKIRAVREASRSRGVPLVLNARSDIYLLGFGDPASRFERTIERLRAYREAGADCLFVPGVKDIETISALVEQLAAPLNILAGPGSPSIPELERLGVARISLGSSIARASLAFARNVARELREGGTYSLLDGAIPYAEVNRLLARNSPGE